MFGFGMTPWVQRLIIANVVIFVLTELLRFPAANVFGFVPAYILVRPWTVVTYMFLHGGWMHLLFNMLGLFFFGPPLEGRWGSGPFLKYYFICGLGGAVLSSIMAIIQPGFAAYVPIIGASGAVYGVMLAFAMNWPDTPIYIWGIFPIPAKILVAMFVAFSLFSAFGGRMDGVAHFAHLGGFAAGYIYLKWEAYRGPKGMRKFRKTMNRRKLTVVPGGEQPARPASAGDARREDASDPHLLDELDRVLDKISTDGMGSLTTAERQLLDQVSKKYRQN